MVICIDIIFLGFIVFFLKGVVLKVFMMKYFFIVVVYFIGIYIGVDIIFMIFICMKDFDLRNLMICYDIVDGDGISVVFGILIGFIGVSFIIIIF